MKRNCILITLLFQFSLQASELETYFSILSKLDRPSANYESGEIQIVTDLEEISKIEKAQENRLLEKGFSTDRSKEFSKIGIIYEDQYWIVLRDAVIFPSVTTGTYNRLLWKNQLHGKFPGVAVLPILPSKKIILILTYRHATGSWELELPRGGIEPFETPTQAAIRELQEETGFISNSMTFLGEMAVDSGTICSIIPIYLANISNQKKSNPELAEAISGSYFFTKEEIKEGLVKGYIEITFKNEKKQVPIRDSFLTFALVQAEYRKLL